MRGLRNHLCVSAAILSLFAVDAADAQQLALEEITVTARKREESLLEVPLSISAFTSDAIEDYNFTDFTELHLATPGLTFNETGVSIRNDRADFAYVIRGLNIGAFAQTASAAILFVDGAPSLFGRLSGFQNAERVEILKGPQTAYFGRNTFSGAINVVTKTPGNEWSGRISGEMSKYDSSDVDISIEGPILEDVLSFRLSGRQLDKGGQYTDHSKGGDIGGRKTTALSGTLYFTPTEELSIKVFGEASELEDEVSAVFDYAMNEFANCSATGNGPDNWICGAIPDTSVAAARIGTPAVFDETFQSDVLGISLFDELLTNHGGLGQEHLTLHSVIDYDFSNDMSFNSIIAYHDKKSQIFHESTHDSAFGFFPCGVASGCPRPFGQYPFLVEEKGKDFSAEGRLTSSQEDRLRWTAGINYVDGKNTPGPIAGELPNVPFRFFARGARTDIETLSFFGGAYYDVTDDFTVSAEFRHQRDKVTSTPFDGAAQAYVTDPASILSGTFKSNAPRISLEYTPTDNTLVFVNWSKGFRPGTFNSNLLTIPDNVLAILESQGAGLEVDEEKLDQYELGVKGTFWDDRIQGSLVGYFGEITNQQVSQVTFFNLPDFINTVGFINNAGKTDMHGVELEGSILFTDNFTVNGSFALNDTEIKTDRCTDCINLDAPGDASVGNRIQNVPKTTGSLTATYTQPITDEVSGYLRSEYFYQGNRYASRMNLARSGAMNRVNFRAGAETESFTLEVFLLNAFNDDTVTGFSQQTDLPSFGRGIKIGLPDKRQWGVRGIYSF